MKCKILSTLAIFASGASFLGASVLKTTLPFIHATCSQITHWREDAELGREIFYTGRDFYYENQSFFDHLYEQLPIDIQDIIAMLLSKKGVIEDIPTTLLTYEGYCSYIPTLMVAQYVFYGVTAGFAGYILYSTFRACQERFKDKEVEQLNSQNDPLMQYGRPPDFSINFS